jgi:hypothetical protein
MEAPKKNLSFLNNIPVNPEAVIIYISCLVFVLRIYACRHVFPELSGMDYYGYIELAKNIFHEFNFTVSWELDSPVQYPPFFSILMYLLTCLTHNFVTSILLINIFSASFYLIPLFSMVRNMLNIYSASLAVVFAVYFYGIKPCYMLNMDFFYSFLVIVICWLIWDTLTHQSRRAGRYVLAGVLIGVADLTKYSGILFGLAGIASILYYFVHGQRDPGRGIKMSAWLLLGALPLIMTYHLLLMDHGPKAFPSIGARVFFDGNYVYDNGSDYREGKISEINPQGTEFTYAAFLKTNDFLDFSFKHPSYIFHKYKWGLNKITRDMTYTVLPVGNIAKSEFTKISPQGDKIIFELTNKGYISVLREVSAAEVQVNPNIYLKKEAIRDAAGVYSGKVWNILDRYRASRKKINLLVQGMFLVLLMISGVYYKWPFNIVHILLFMAGMLLIPLCSAEERYLMPFMPLYSVLWLFGFNACYGMIKTVMKDDRFLRYWVILLSICLAAVYVISTCKQIHEQARFYAGQGQIDATWRKAAAWIEADSRDLPKRAKIMSLDNYMSYLTDSDYIRLPYFIFDWDRVLNFAVFKKVDYMVISGDFVDSFLTFSEDEFKKPRTPQALLGAVEKRIVKREPGVGDAHHSIDSLNRLLEFRNLYEVLPQRPTGAMFFIHQLQKGRSLNLPEIRWLNRVLIEANFPDEFPPEGWLNRNAESWRIKIIYDLIWPDNTILIYKV